MNIELDDNATIAAIVITLIVSFGTFFTLSSIYKKPSPRLVLPKNIDVETTERLMNRYFETVEAIYGQECSKCLPTD